MVCGFTGHRPEKLPWGTVEEDPRCRALKVLIAREVKQAVDAGVTDFACGMARGCDTYFAEAVLALRDEMPCLRLTAWLPCAGQADLWQEADPIRWKNLLNCCDEVRLLEPVYSDGCMLRRDKAMVDCADMILSVWDGSTGGTGWTVSYAKRQGKPVRAIWL